MPYRLYKTSGGYEYITTDDDESKICLTIGNRLKQDPNERFMIIKNFNNGDEAYKGIRSQEDYIEYREELDKRTENKRLSNMSAMELRKEMMDIVYGKPKVMVKSKEKQNSLK